MSSVFIQTKNVYKKTFLIEFFFIFIGTWITYFCFTDQVFSFLFGALIAVLPQIAFIGYALYLKGNQPVENKVKVLYQSEVLKLVLTVILFIIAFYFFALKSMALFLGYFIFIVLNNLLPALLNSK
ncbi:ATP synthase subunit I [Mannheimia massilioguelmaensis]|uniref:ATP synthase subunit I n=1 Tax=Mannheimia massilioguelmaensis TaxID=1604354 RepID=UPI0005CA3102|nr:ATP synthase subunit I [Mannheimia massilioguelmaensis]